jgi:hypothetical protein
MINFHCHVIKLCNSSLTVYEITYYSNRLYIYINQLVIQNSKIYIYIYIDLLMISCVGLSHLYLALLSQPTKAITFSIIYMDFIMFVYVRFIFTLLYINSFVISIEKHKSRQRDSVLSLNPNLERHQKIPMRFFFLPFNSH